MPHNVYDVVIYVRRAGKITDVKISGDDKNGLYDKNGRFHPFEERTGDRRSNQIAKRHWIRKSVSWCGGGAGEYITTKPPGKKECELYSRTFA
jgi:hypothetical protein